jgi:hypothetical protein
LIVEYGGRQHGEDTEQWLEELDRRRWRLVVITSDAIYLNPLRTLVGVRDALRECGAVGICRSFKAPWRVHFLARSTA